MTIDRFKVPAPSVEWFRAVLFFLHIYEWCRYEWCRDWYGAGALADSFPERSTR